MKEIIHEGKLITRQLKGYSTMFELPTNPPTTIIISSLEGQELAAFVETLDRCLPGPIPMTEEIGIHATTLLMDCPEDILPNAPIVPDGDCSHN